MAENKILLDTAAFLDSPQAAALDDVPVAHRRAIVERFLTCAYEELGKAPHLLDGHDLHEIVGHLMPGRFGRKDAAAPHLERVLGAYLAHLGEVRVVSNAYELRQALASTAPEFEQSVASGKLVHHHAARAPAKPFVHQADKTGRNDPCPCGSGRKFKKCCAQLG